MKVMSRFKVKSRLNFRFYIVLLGTAYFSMLYVFHGHLQTEMNSRCGQGQAHCGSFVQLNLHTPHISYPAISSAVPIDKLSNKLSRDDINLHIERKRKMLESSNIGKSAGSAEFLPNIRLMGSESRRPVVKPLRSVPVIMERAQIMPAGNNSRQSPSPVPRHSRIHDLETSASCYLPANFSDRAFHSVDVTSYVYSAYLDERYDTRIVRIMALLVFNKARQSVSSFCYFKLNDSYSIKSEGTLYELCENHGKTYGGYMVSCEVPKSLRDVCTVAVSIDVTPLHGPPQTMVDKRQVLNVTKLSPHGSPSHYNISSRHSKPFQTYKKYNFSVCIPPLFGNIPKPKLVEFIELNRILGFEHFIFYVTKVVNTSVLKVLKYYQSINVVSIVNFTLPDKISKKAIWYNGQLTAHNDCVYRAMSITNYVAIMDIDEYIVPHNGKYNLIDTLVPIFQSAPNVCGLGFDSAFYDQKLTAGISQDSLPRKDSRDLRKDNGDLRNKDDNNTVLITQSLTGKSARFSTVRTKVLVRPEMIFEVGIHHISKPAKEQFKVLKVNRSLAYLHHYRDCVPNYGMNCQHSQNDPTMLQYGAQLHKHVDRVLSDSFNTLAKTNTNSRS